jgi:Putative prokaryotic signal transducing protein
MTELFRERDYTKVGYFESVLEAEGIPTFVRNKHLTMSGLTEIPIPEFFPALCVMNDQDYEPAMEIIRKHLTENSVGVEREVTCDGCGETNPGNFDVCWSCGGDIADPVAM